jgi:capsular polysaccharide biosynthesis protein
MTLLLERIKQHIWNTDPAFFHSLISWVRLSSQDIKLLHADQVFQSSPPQNQKASLLRGLRVVLIYTKLVLGQFLGYDSKLTNLSKKLRILKVADLHDQMIFAEASFKNRSRTGELSAISTGQKRRLKPTVVTEGHDKTFLIRDVTLVGGSSLVFQGSQVIWGQAQFPENRNSLYPNDSILVAHDSTHVAVAFDPCLGAPSKSISSGLSLLDSAGSSFGHFVLGAIPKLRVLWRLDPLQACTIIIDGSWPEHYKNFVNELIPHAEIVELARGDTLQVDNLHFPEPLKHFPDHIKPGSPHGFEARAFSLPEFSYLFEQHQLAPTPRSNKGVFLFRKGTQESNRRQIINIDEVKRYLREKGFKDISSQYADVKQLHNELREATHIVTDDGSISFNLLLAGISGKNVIFFSGPDFGAFQEWGLPGYLALFNNDVMVVSGKCKLPQNQFKPWWIELEDLQYAFEQTTWKPHSKK